MAKNFKKEKSQSVKDEMKQSFFVYEDGFSYWGMSLIRNGVYPKECSKDVHAMETEQKVEWYKGQ